MYGTSERQGIGGKRVKLSGEVKTFEVTDLKKREEEGEERGAGDGKEKAAATNEIAHAKPQEV